MANGSGFFNGNVELFKKGAVVGIPVTALIAFMLVTYNNISNQTAIAIDVARQHGEELRLLRQDYTELHGEIAGISKQIAAGTDDRFRGRDAVAMEQRLIERIRLVEARVERNHP